MADGEFHGNVAIVIGGASHRLDETVSSLREHGLEVLCCRNEGPFRHPFHRSDPRNAMWTPS